MRALYPLGEFQVVGQDGLYDAAKSVAWEEHLNPDSTFAVQATLTNSEHTHSGFVALKIKDAIVDKLREKYKARPDVDTRNPDVTVIAHISKQTLSLSLDLCGEALHRRGYRVTPTLAPLKETLAAAILRAAKFTAISRQRTFYYPPKVCGSQYYHDNSSNDIFSIVAGDVIKLHQRKGGCVPFLTCVRRDIDPAIVRDDHAFRVVRIDPAIVMVAVLRSLHLFQRFSAIDRME